MKSFSDYKPGSATAAYRLEVDKAAAITEAQKARVDPMYHEKIDRLLDTYARKLAENINQGYAIDARCPSVLIAGPANFPVRKKEQQNRASDVNMEEWKYIQGLLDKIRGTGMGSIGSDDSGALPKLRKKLAQREREQLMQRPMRVCVSALTRCRKRWQTHWTWNNWPGLTSPALTVFVRPSA